MYKKTISILKSRGVIGLSQVAMNRLIPRKPLEAFDALKTRFAEKTAIEVGGPSGVFKRGGLFPVYPVLKRLDNCNFGATTVWEGSISSGETFRYDKSRDPGYQYVMEASDLSVIPSDQYDCFLSSHALEHIANPLHALSEWVRVTKIGGTIVLVIPHKLATFDHSRPVTTLDHLIEDWKNSTSENDLTHLPEILELHDLSMDPEAGDIIEFEKRSRKNFENRCLHHHVFDTQLAIDMINYIGLQIHHVECKLPHHIFIVAEKIGTSSRPNNSTFIQGKAFYCDAIFPKFR
jgi:SAM-dependent methyltransferase